MSPGAAAGPAPEAAGLTRCLGEHRAVDGVSFTVAHGEIFGLLGSNGAGKSATVRMFTGDLVPTAGRARVEAIDVAANARSRCEASPAAFGLYGCAAQKGRNLYQGLRQRLMPRALVAARRSRSSTNRPRALRIASAHALLESP